jgi:hypothetical protein
MQVGTAEHAASRRGRGRAYVGALVAHTASRAADAARRGDTKPPIRQAGHLHGEEEGNALEPRSMRRHREEEQMLDGALGFTGGTRRCVDQPTSRGHRAIGSGHRYRWLDKEEESESGGGCSGHNVWREKAAQAASCR